MPRCTIGYWIRKGLSSDEAKLRATGHGSCVICGTVTNKKLSKSTARFICSDECNSQANLIRLESSRLTKLAQNKKPCMICNNPMSKKDSFNQLYFVCSKECNEIRHRQLPKQLTITCREYWMKQGLSETEASKKVAYYQRRRSCASVDSWLRRGYTLEESLVLANDWQKMASKKKSEQPLELHRLSSHRCVEYWLAKGLTEDEAHDAVSKANTLTSLEAFIARHGMIEGQRRFQLHAEKSKHSFSLEHAIERFGEMEGTKIWLQKYQRGNISSKIAMRVFNKVFDEIGLEIPGNVYFHSDNRTEFGRSGNGRYYFYDFVAPSLSLCIEINGAFHHADPRRYKSGDLIVIGGKKFLVDDLWEKDRIKRKLLEDDGYTVIEIWFRKDSEFSAIVKQCISLITEKVTEYNMKVIKDDSYCDKKDLEPNRSEGL